MTTAEWTAVLASDGAALGLSCVGVLLGAPSKTWLNS